MLEYKQVHVSTSTGSVYGRGGAPGALLTRGVEVRASKVPAEYRRKADKADRKYCGAGPGEWPGPVRRRLDSMREVLPLVFGSMGESSSSVRELAKATAEVAALNRSCRADFNL